MDNPLDKLCDGVQNIQSSFLQSDTPVTGQRLTMRVAEVAEGFFTDLWNSVAGQKKFAILGAENLVEGHLPYTPYDDEKVGSDEVIIQVAVMKLDDKGVAQSAHERVMKVAVKVADLAEFIGESASKIQKDEQGYAKKTLTTGTRIQDLVIQKERALKNLQQASPTTPTLFAEKTPSTYKVQELNRAYCDFKSNHTSKVYSPLMGNHFVVRENRCSLNPDTPKTTTKPQTARQTLITQLDKPNWKPGFWNGIVDWFTDFGKKEEFKGIEEQYGKEACELYKKTYSESRGDFVKALNDGLKHSHDAFYGSSVPGWSDPKDTAPSLLAFQKGNFDECKKISDAGEIKALGLMMIEQALIDFDSTKLYKHLCPKGTANDNQTMAKEIRESVCNQGGNPSLNNYLSQVCKLDPAHVQVIEKMVSPNYAERPDLETLKVAMRPRDIFTLQ